MILTLLMMHRTGCGACRNHDPRLSLVSNSRSFPIALVNSIGLLQIKIQTDDAGVIE
jgi:hypothetical protein